jgi:hypothetical protein
LTSAETLSAIGIDQNRDGGRGVRLISDARRPESALRSAHFQGAEPGLNSILAAQDALRPRETTKTSSEAPRRKTGRQNPRRVRSQDAGGPTGNATPAKSDSMRQLFAVEPDVC